MTAGVDNEKTRWTKTTRAQCEIFLIEQTHANAKCNLWFYQIIHGALNLEVLANAIKVLASRVPLL